MEHLSAVRAGGAVEVQEAVALGAERAARATLDDGGGGPVVVVGAQRPRVRVARALLSRRARAARPAGGRRGSPSSEATPAEATRVSAHSSRWDRSQTQSAASAVQIAGEAAQRSGRRSSSGIRAGRVAYSASAVRVSGPHASDTLS